MVYHQFQANIPFLLPLKTETLALILWFSGVYRTKPVNTHHFNVYKTSLTIYTCLIDAGTTLCVYKDLTGHEYPQQ